MKSIYKIFLLALGVYTSAFSQITEITRLPVQDISQSIKESVSVSNKKLKSILNEFKRANRYEVTFNSAGLASGVYIYQLRTKGPETSSGQGIIQTKKMVLLK